MGDPKKARKKYIKPSHPWQKKRIDEEKKLVKEFGFKNKTEIWKLATFLKNIKKQVKSNIAVSNPQVEKEKQALMIKLTKLNLIKDKGTLDEVLSLSLRDVLNRRLQTVVFQKGLARSMKQARQFIVHQHIVVDNKKITSPNYLVDIDEEKLISFTAHSNLNDPDHPERTIIEKKPKKVKEVKVRK